MHAGNHPHSVQNTSAPEVKQAAYGETRTAIIKKKLMKNKKFELEASAPANAVQQSSIKTSTLPRLDYKLRRRNQQLPTQKLLALLEAEAPDFWRMAHVVGKWVWIQFSDKQPPTVTRVLAELGFHWNNTRQAWQHPCGTIPDERATYDPRRRYGSYFAADQKPA